MQYFWRITIVALLFASPELVLSQGAESALNFNNANASYVEIPDNSALRPSNFTLEAWFKIEASTGDHQIILSKQYGSTSANSYALYCFHNGGNYNLRFYGFGSSVHINSSNFELGVWHHAAVSYDGTTVYLYLNGIEVASAAQGSAPDYDNNPVLIGADNDDSNNDYEFLFNGEIDEVRIWSVARSAGEIRDNINKTLSGSESNLAGYWNFDAGSGTTANDQSSNSNDGSLGSNTGGSNPSWVTSTAKAGDESIFSIANSDISEKAGCMVDIDLSNEGTAYSYAVYQVNSAPNSTTDLLSYVANKYWELKASDAEFDQVFTADIDFHYDEIGGISDESNLKLYRRDDAADNSWDEVSGITVFNEGNNSDGNGYISFSLSESSSGGFSGQYIITSSDADNQTLPVELLSFNANQENEFIVVSWATASEIGSDYFEVERSFDGLNWESIATVQSAGYSNSVKNYSIKVQPEINTPIIFYRLKQVDFDGDITTYEAIAFNYKISDIKIFYSKDNRFIKLSVPTSNKKLRIELIDLKGEVKFRGATDGNVSRINTNHIATGLYLLRVTNDINFSRTYKLFIDG